MSTLLDPPKLTGVGSPPSHRTPPTGGEGGGGGDGDWAGAGRPHQTHIAVFGIWILLASIFMLFMAFVTAYVVRQDMGTDWRRVPVPTVLWGSTLVLLLSSGVLERGRRVLRRTGTGRGWILSALALGMIFVLGQALAWHQLDAAGNGIGTAPYSSFFYLLTGVHAIHLGGGLVGLALAAAWPARRWPSTPPQVVVRVAAIYWHFMAILWVGLFLLLRFWQ